MKDLPAQRTPDGIAYWTLGAGPALLCVHGGPGTDHSFFRPYLDSLADDVQLVYFDLPGHGQSQAAMDYGLESMAQAIGSVRTALGVERVSLLGSSYGGFLSLEYVARNPDVVTALLLVDTSASHGFRGTSLETARRRGTPVMLAALDRLWDGSLSTDDEFRSAWTELLPLYFHQLGAAEIKRLAGQATYRLETRKRILPTLADYDVRERLQDISTPALVIVGQHDWITGMSQARELAGGLKESTMLVFTESGHYPFIEENAEFLRQVRAWLVERVRNH